jgi:hypothetical protein
MYKWIWWKQVTCCFLMCFTSVDYRMTLGSLFYDGRKRKGPGRRTDARRLGTLARAQLTAACCLMQLLWTGSRGRQVKFLSPESNPPGQFLFCTYCEGITQQRMWLWLVSTSGLFPVFTDKLEKYASFNHFASFAVIVHINWCTR